jgi:hypothetical protein
MRTLIALTVVVAVTATTAYFGARGVEATWGNGAVVASLPFWCFVNWCVGAKIGYWAGPWVDG